MTNFMGNAICLGQGIENPIHTSSQGQVDGRPDCANQRDGQVDTKITLETNVGKHWRSVSNMHYFGSPLTHKKNQDVDPFPKGAPPMLGRLWNKLGKHWVSLSTIRIVDPENAQNSRFCRSPRRNTNALRRLWETI